MNTAAILAGLGISLLVCVILTPLLIPMLIRLKFGQEIREEGPAWHAKKSGTPTMGGIAFIAATAIVALLACIAAAVWGDVKTVWPFIYVLLYGVLNGLIGVVDDSAKLRKKQNE